jgi:signal transduction histidine kinase
MENKNIDQRVVSTLRWSLIVQIIFLVQSSFLNRIYSRLQGLKLRYNSTSFLPLLVISLIFILLSFTEIQSKITKSTFLLILYILALITIFSRQFIFARLGKGPEPPFPLGQHIRWEWDMIFFLIIPLVFIAWQFSMREVIYYCLLIIAAEAVPLVFSENRRELFFMVANLISDIARSSVLAIVGWIENRLVAVQREQHSQLVSANIQLRKYALTNEKLAQTQERNRLARELHDTLAHTLSSVSVQLEATKALFDRDPKKARKMLADTIKNTKNGLTETRRTLVDMRSSELESYGLTQALRNLGNSAAERGGFKVSYHLDKGMDVLSDEIGHCLYRTAQEALENTLKHANAKNVDVKLMFDADSIKLHVIDDGKGFEAEQLKDEHLGIRGMRERVEMLGGTFTVESESGSGTQISIILENEND